MSYIFIFIIGLIMGSFFNVCIYRIPRKQSISFPPSHCPECKERIRPYDLIPIVSYFVLGGKCRNCKAKISFQYPLIELITGFLYLIIFSRFGFSKELIVFAFLASLLIMISFIDLHFRIIPNKLVLFGVIVGVPITFWGGRTFLEIILGGMVGFLIMLVIALVSRGGMGGGDVKMMGMVGVYLGWQLTIVSLFLSFLVGAIGGIVLMMLKIKGRKDFIPFGPFIALGTMLTILYGFDFLGWYLKFL